MDGRYRLVRPLTGGDLREIVLDVTVLEQSRPMGLVASGDQLHLFVDGSPTMRHVVLDSTGRVLTTESLYGFYPAPFVAEGAVELVYGSTLDTPGPSRNELYWAKRADAGWEPRQPLYVRPNQRSHVPVAVSLSGGRRAVAWLEDADLDGLPEQLLISTRQPTGEWSEPVSVATASGGHRLGRPAIVRSGEDALVAFSVYDDEETRYLAFAVGSPRRVFEVGSSPNASSGIALASTAEGPVAYWIHRGEGLRSVALPGLHRPGARAHPSRDADG